jgi:hypothetical protein
VASPDTDELATVPMPSGAPESESSAGAEAQTMPQERAEPHTVPQERAEPAAGRGVAEPQTVPQQQTELLATGPDVAEAQTVLQQQTEPLATGPDMAEAQTMPQERVEPERIDSPDTSSADASEAGEPAEPAKQGGRWWRGFTGSLAAGLAVLAIGVLVVAGIDLNTGAPGPGAVLLIGHPVAAMLALLAQRVADRRNGAPAVGAGVAVVLFTVSALTLFWLA